MGRVTGVLRQRPRPCVLRWKICLAHSSWAVFSRSMRPVTTIDRSARFTTRQRILSAGASIETVFDLKRDSLFHAARFGSHDAKDVS